MHTFFLLKKWRGHPSREPGPWTMLPTWSPLKLQKVCSGNLLCLPREFGCHRSGRWGAICSHLCNTTKQQRAKCVLSHSGRHACYFTLGSEPGVLKPVGASIRVGHMGLNTDAAEWLFPCWCVYHQEATVPWLWIQPGHSQWLCGGRKVQNK